MIGPTVERWIMRGLLPLSIRHVRRVSYGQTEGLSREVYDQMARDFQIVPPFTLHACDPAILAAVWTVFRESSLAGPVSRVDREAVAVAVSQRNQCAFCVDAHTMMLHGGHAHALVRRLLKTSSA